MWACEDDEDEIWRRQVAICEHFQIELAGLDGKFTIMPRHGLDNTLFALSFGAPAFTPAFELLREQVSDLASDVLVLDNLAQTYGGHESDRHQVTLFVNGISGLGRGRPFCPALLGHTARSATSEFSGSSAWENTTRMRWYMSRTLPDQPPREDDDSLDAGLVYLCKRKANYSAQDWRRLQFRRGLLLPEEHAGRRFDQGYRNDLAEQIVLKAMTKLQDIGLCPTDSKNASDYLPRQILAKGFAEGHTRYELEAAMNRLMGAGKLKRGPVGTYPNRHPRYGLVHQAGS